MSTSPPLPGAPRKLERADNRETFNSGAEELDAWLSRYAWENQRANNAVTFVSCVGNIVVAYYSIAVSAVAKEEAPAKVTQGAPSQIPCILLARLAVDLAYAGHGIGVALLRDALLRSLQLSETVGARAVLIHARDDAARAFYEHNADCYPSPLDSHQLMIPMKWIRQSLLR